MSQSHSHTHAGHAAHDSSWPKRPKMSQLNLVPREVDLSVIDSIRDLIFEADEKKWAKHHPGGSPMKRWYRSVSAVDQSSEEPRRIAWKVGKPFKPQNLFYKSVDTNRFLPMHLAAFQVNYYGLPRTWDSVKNPNEYAQTMVSALLHPLLLLRNMHDCGGADVPILLVDWHLDFMKAAMDYWVELSAGKWSDVEALEELNRIERSAKECFFPCLHQATLFIRAMLSDPEVGYVPPFIILLQARQNAKATALFTRPWYALPDSLAAGFPTSCGNPGCEDNDCAIFHPELCKTLADNSPMVRDHPFRRTPVTRCNLWGCNALHTEDHPLQVCGRCKEVLYCSRKCQAEDWPLHKTICEHRAA